MTRAGWVGIFAVCAAAVTVAGGWWLMPVLAAAWVRVGPRPGGSPGTCGLGAALGWALLLAWDAAPGGAGRLAGRVGGVFFVPDWGFVAFTLLFGALLAATAAIVARTNSR